jgi:hypothetical protein
MVGAPGVEHPRRTCVQRHALAVGSREGGARTKGRRDVGVLQRLAARDVLAGHACELELRRCRA